MDSNGLETIASSRDFKSTLDGFASALGAKGLMEFGRIDYGATAAQAGLPHKPCVLVIFGNRTTILQLVSQKPLVGIDLPLKALVWESPTGGINITINDPRWVLARHQLGGQPAEAVRLLVQTIAQEAAGTVKAN